MTIEKLKQIIEKELNNRKVYEDALEVVRSIEGLAQYEKETKANIVRAVADFDAAKKNLVAAEKELADAKAENIKVRAKAQEQGDAIVAKARAEADEYAAKTRGEVEKLTNQSLQLSGDIELLTEKRSKAQAEFDAVEKALAAARGKLKAFVGE
jgi:uncharacterized protein (DUF3084 family)